MLLLIVMMLWHPHKQVNEHEECDTVKFSHYPIDSATWPHLTAFLES